MARALPEIARRSAPLRGTVFHVSVAEGGSRAGLRELWRGLGRPARLLLLAVACDYLGTGFVLPFYVVYFRDVRHVPVQDIGVLIAVPFVVSALAAGPIGALVDRLGVGAVVVAAFGWLAASQIAMSVAATVPWIGVVLVALGIGFVAQAVSTMALTAELVPSALRSRFFGVRFALMNIALAAGGVVSGLFVSLTHPQTFSTVFVIDAVSYLLALVVVIAALSARRTAARIPASQPPPSPEDATSTGEAPPAEVTYTDVWSQPVVRLLVGVALVFGFVGYAQLNVGFPAFARAVGASPRTIGFAFAVNGVVIVLAQLLVVVRLEGVRRTRALLTVSVLWATAWLLLGASHLSLGSWAVAGMLVLCSAVFALGETFLQPSLPAITNDVATERSRGRVNALMTGTDQTGFVLGTVLAGWLIGGGHLNAYIAVLLAGCAAVGLVAVHGLEQRLTPEANGIRVAEPTTGQ